MKRTKKYEAAMKIAGDVLGFDQLKKVRRSNELLNAALEAEGYFWDAEGGAWSAQRKSTSMFQTDEGMPTGEFRLRVMATPAIWIGCWKP